MQLCSAEGHVTRARGPLCLEYTEREEATWRLRATRSGTPAIRFELSRVNRVCGATGLLHPCLCELSFSLVPENSSFLHFRCALVQKTQRIGFSMCNEGEKRQAAQNPADAGAFSRAGARSQTPERIKGERKRGQRRRFCDS